MSEKRTTLSDQKLVDYLLKLLPEAEQQALAEEVEKDNKLQQRLAVWQNALFNFYDDIPEQTPPEHVWRAIEQKLFADELVNQKTQTKPQKRIARFWYYLTPALLTLCLLFIVTFYWQHHPTYQATVIAETTPTMLWKIEGNKNSIAFTSTQNVSVENMDCVAWLQHGDSSPVVLGVIPDKGNKTSLRIELPKSLEASAGDRIIIAMVQRGSIKKLPAKDKQHIVQLTEL